ncbi:hypothetical protein LTS18_004646, partial [Coniosporium uncinatum]
IRRSRSSRYSLDRRRLWTRYLVSMVHQPRRELEADRTSRRDGPKHIAISCRHELGGRGCCKVHKSYQRTRRRGRRVRDRLQQIPWSLRCCIFRHVHRHRAHKV